MMAVKEKSNVVEISEAEASKTLKQQLAEAKKEIQKLKMQLLWQECSYE